MFYAEWIHLIFYFKVHQMLKIVLVGNQVEFLSDKTGLIRLINSRIIWESRSHPSTTKGGLYDYLKLKFLKLYYRLFNNTII